MFGPDNYLGGLNGLYDFEIEFSKSLQIEDEISTIKNKKNGSIKRRRRSLDRTSKRHKA